MTLTDPERSAIRRFCGYPPYGQGPAGFQGWRYYQARGLLEFRMTYLTEPEIVVVRRYLGQLEELETPGDSDTGDSREASLRILHDWRLHLCGFLGIPPGPELEKGVAA